MTNCTHPARFTDDGACVECRQPADDSPGPENVAAAPLKTVRTRHRHLAAPEDVIAQAIRVADGQHKLGAGALGEAAVKALREAGYTLMRPVCEPCDDDGFSW